MTIPPPLLPELDGSRPAAASVGPAPATVRLGARVVAAVGADAVIETRHGRALLQGAPSLRPGSALILELQHAGPVLALMGSLVRVDGERLEPPQPIRLQLVPASQPAATVRSGAPLDVTLRVVGADDRPTTPAFPARLAVALPEPGTVASASGASMAAPSGRAVARHGPSPGPNHRGDAMLPAAGAGPLVTSRPVSSAAQSATVAGTGGTPGGISGGLPEQLAVLVAQKRAIEAFVLPRDVLGRTLLRAAGFTFQVETPIDLPAAARLQLIFPAGPARARGGPPQQGPLDAVRMLVALLHEPAGMEQPFPAGAPPLPRPDASLAARLLRLMQLIARAGEASVPETSEPAGAAAPPGDGRIKAALAELGRLAGEPQSGGWRVLLLPLGFAGTPLLRLYVREDPGEEDGAKDGLPDRSLGARRAVFELELNQLGRCQIDVLCQARRCDLLVRTEQPLSPRLRREIRELYLAARDIAGLAGAVRFHAGGWVALPEPFGAGGPVGGITV